MLPLNQESIDLIKAVMVGEITHRQFTSALGNSHGTFYIYAYSVLRNGYIAGKLKLELIK